MSQQFFPVQRSVPLAQALAEQVLVHYPLATPVTCHLFQRGINDLYIVQAGASSESEGSRYFLRVTPSGRRTVAELQAEMALSERLVEQSVPIAGPVARHDGSYLQALAAPEGIRYALLFEDAGSSHSDELEMAQHHEVGRSLAQVHRVAMQMAVMENVQPFDRTPIDLALLVDEPLQLAAATFPDREAELGVMRQAGELLYKAVEKLPQSPDLYGLCHGDFHSGNVLINGDGKPVIIDFDECGPGWFVYDVATYLWSHLFPMPQDPEEKIRDAFLAGYQSVRPLSDLEIDSLPLFIALRHFWVGGLAVRQAANDGMVALNDQQFAYFIYFLQSWMEQFQEG